MSVPSKYRAIGDFHEYYSGKRTAPYLTIFVGGNHEASSHLQELYYGGWVAKNIYYLGAANVVRFGDLRIAGLSGIWKGYNYNKPHFERLPYTGSEVKSLYDVREMDIRKLLLVRTQVDVGISHDWPRGIELLGDHKTLFRHKVHLQADSETGKLGSAAAKYVMDRLRPPHWFAAHLHCKFAASVNYENRTKPTKPPDSYRNETVEIESSKNRPEIGQIVQGASEANAISTTKNENEIDLDLDMDDESSQEDQKLLPNSVNTEKENFNPEASTVPIELRSQLPAAFSRPPSSNVERRPPLQISPPPPGITNKETSFLALDKCLPNRKFLQILEIKPLESHGNPSTPPRLAYDPEWLAILRVFGTNDPHLPLPPNLGEVAYAPLVQAQEAWVEENLVKKDRMLIPDNFQITAPVYDGKDIRTIGRTQPEEYTNPQTKVFCELLGIPNWFDASDEEREERAKAKGLEIESEAQVAGSGFGGGRGWNNSGRGSHRGGGRGKFRGGTGQGRGRGYR